MGKKDRKKKKRQASKQASKQQQQTRKSRSSSQFELRLQSVNLCAREPMVPSNAFDRQAFYSELS